MEDDQKQIETDRQRAEVFDALGHPTRILILKVLSEGAMGFADLKKKTGFESSGHLQHHLTKLNGLIKTDEYGKYCLSDQGKDALLTVQTVENATAKTSGYEKTQKINRRLFNSKISLKPLAFLLVALLIASSAIAVYEYSQTVSLRNNPFSNGVDPEAAAYHTEFGDIVPVTNVNSSFAPPVSMYQALLIGLNADGWNKTSLKGMVIYASLMPWQTVTNQTEYQSNLKLPIEVNLTQVMTPPASYTDVYGNGVIYQYVWQIDIMKAGVFQTPPPGFILIDASTGQIVPNPPLY
jgi:DNA-binding HxlR family transcriptional regulator